MGMMLSSLLGLALLGQFSPNSPEADQIRQELIKRYQPEPGVFANTIVEASTEASPGIVYIVVTNSDSVFIEKSGQEIFVKNPDFIGDPSQLNARYEGLKRIQVDGKQKVVKVPTSFNSIIEYLVEKQMGYQNVGWSKGSISLELPADFLHRRFQQLGRQGPSFLAGLPDGKQKLFHSLLFGQEFSLNQEVLKELRRSGDVGAPAPVDFPISIPSEALFGQVKGYFVSLFWRMQRIIQIEELTFKIRERKLRFDPELNVLDVELVADQAILRGPMHDIGEVPRIIDFRAYDRYHTLLAGQLDGISLRFYVDLEKDENGLWSIDGEVEDSFQINFDDEVPTVVMDLIKTKFYNPHDEFETQEVIRLESGTRPYIESKLRAIVINALGGRYLEDAVGASLDFAVRNDFNEEGSLPAQVRASNFRVGRNSVQLDLDTRFLMPEVASCVSEEYEKWKNQRPKISHSNNPEPNWLTPTSDSPKPWLFVWEKETGEWVYQQQPAQGGQYIKARIHREFLNSLMAQAWASGLLCLSSRQLENRPASMEWLRLKPVRPPQFVATKDGWQLILQLELSEWKDSRAEVILKNIQIKMDLLDNASATQAELRLHSVESADLTDKEDQIVQELIIKVISELGWMVEEQERGESYWVSILDWGQFSDWDKNPGIKFSSLSWNEENLLVSLSLEDQMFEAPKVEEKDKEPATEKIESLPELKTRFVDYPRSFIVRNNYVDLSWEQENEFPVEHRILYRYRYKAPSGWSPYTLYSDENSFRLFLEEEGSYIFEVQARDEQFNKELEPAQVEFYFRPVQKVEDDPPAVENWNEPEDSEPEENKETRSIGKEKEVRAYPRAKAKGPFGCSLGS